MDTNRLEKIGFKVASQKVKEMREQNRKMTIAYEHFRFVRQEKIEAFQEKLRKDTFSEDKNANYYKHLAFTPLESYTEVPPNTVLDEIEKAQELNCFDYFEIAKVESVKQIKDPIVFGRIKGCPDRFYIAQWDDDVKIEDIISENEG